jgi:hypothetical protein
MYTSTLHKNLMKRINKKYNEKIFTFCLQISPSEFQNNHSSSLLMGLMYELNSCTTQSGTDVYFLIIITAL